MGSKTSRRPKNLGLQDFILGGMDNKPYLAFPPQS